MAGLVVLFFVSGWILGWSAATKLNNRVLTLQNKLLKKRVQDLRLIWTFLDKPIPSRK